MKTDFNLYQKLCIAQNERVSKHERYTHEEVMAKLRQKINDKLKDKK